MRKNVILFVSIILLTYSCGEIVPIEKYCGGIVIFKSVNSTCLDLKYGGEIVSVRLYPYDYNRYKEGDTIKCSKEDEILYKEKEKQEVSEDEEEEDIWSR